MNREREQLRGIVARGYCHEKNAKKELDGDLLEAIVDELLAAAPVELTTSQDTVFALAEHLANCEGEDSTEMLARSILGFLASITAPLTKLTEEEVYKALNNSNVPGIGREITDYKLLTVNLNALLAQPAPPMSDEIFKQRADEEDGQIVSVCSLPNERNSMTRAQAVEVARSCAKAKPQSYYSEPFQPHEWVIDAILLGVRLYGAQFVPGEKPTASTLREFVLKRCKNSTPCWKRGLPPFVDWPLCSDCIKDTVELEKLLTAAEQRAREPIQRLRDELGAMELTANRKTKVGRAAEAVVHLVRVRLDEILVTPSGAAQGGTDK